MKNKLNKIQDRKQTKILKKLSNDKNNLREQRKKKPDIQRNKIGIKSYE